jgi:hypothetical protein
MPITGTSRDISRAAALQLLISPPGTGGRPRHSNLLVLEPTSDRVHGTLVFARGNVRDELSVDQLADVAPLGQSPEAVRDSAQPRRLS